MIVRNWFGMAIALFYLICALTDFVPGEAGDRFQYSNPNTGQLINSGRPLTEDEFFTLQHAMANILVSPPESLTFADENGDSHRVSCLNAGLDLMEQLRGGRTEAETLAKGSSWTLPDSSKSPGSDQLNVDPVAVARAETSADFMRELEGILVHEWWHKNQDTASLRNNDEREEVAPYNVMAAYYCSTATPRGDTNDWRYKWARKAARDKTPPAQPGANLVRSDLGRNVGEHFVFLRFDTAAVGGADSLCAYSDYDEIFHSYSLAPMRASDMVIIENPPFLPPEHHLLVVYGGLEAPPIARILMLDYFEGEVSGITGIQDYGLPAYPPMFFASATKQDPEGPWFVLDSLNHQILMMQDLLYGDGVPDEITGVFASASWPGMEPLMNARGLQIAGHPFMGLGITMLEEGAHHNDALYVHDMNYFLVDTDGNLQADVMLALPLYEFLIFTPIIQVPRPWPGDMSLTLFATWEHEVEIWSTDSTGELMYEPLGVVHVGPGVDAECPLVRPLTEGEYVMPRDVQTGKHPTPWLVEAPVPEHLVISVGPGGGVLFLSWDPVSGAVDYAIWMSEDGTEFLDSGMRTPVPEFAIPLMGNKYFFQVRAIR